MGRKNLETARKYWERNGLFRVANIDGTTVRWYSALQSINPALLDYAWVASSGQNVVIAISDSLPEDYQKFWAYHELIENTQNSREDKCLRTLKKELAIIPKEIKSEYISRRTAFFNSLIRFGKENNFPTRSVEEFEKSLGHLERLTG